MRGILAGLVICLTLGRLAAGQESLHLMPMPSQVQVGDGQLIIDPSFTVAINGTNDPRLQRAVDRFLGQLRRQTGMLPLDFKIGEPGRLAIHADQAAKAVPELGEDESYSLEVTSAGAKLNAPTTLGVLRGLQTFLQLVGNASAGFAVPAVTIHDAPRFGWRGLMIDSGRHFMPLDVMERNLDGMEAVKLNVLHWHLSEDQGFRVESKKFPKLQEMGSDGLYYTQEQIRDVIAYAADRGIRVIPEFDMPGHSTSWFVGYPELSSGPGPYQIERKWGVFDPAMNPTEEKTYKFLDTFIGEMAKLFPDKFFHVGGDEVNGKQWNANAKIQEFMKSHQLKDNEALQAYFNQHIQKIVSKHGKIMIGWDEILQPDLPNSIVIQSWRGQKSLAEAARKGYRGILSAGYYLDLNYPASQHYAVDPLRGETGDLSPDEKKLVLGGEAAMWAEYVSPENVDSRVWPRTAAIAERLWSPQNVTDVESMYRRMAAVSEKLNWLGLTHNSSYKSMLERMAGSPDFPALKSLADVVEPVKGYERSDLAAEEATSATPLNRLIDAARPESISAREFGALVDDFVGGRIKPGSEARIRQLLSKWQDNNVKLQALGAQSFLVQEAVPISQNLAAMGAAGLQALDYLDRGERAPDAWKAEQLTMLEQAKKPKAQVLLMVVPAIQKLVEASAAPR